MKISLLGQIWEYQPPSVELIRQVQVKYKLPFVISQYFASKINEIDLQEDEIEAWLNPSLDHLHDPYLMLGMDIAVQRILKAKECKEKILVVTDFDVDGTTSSLVLQSTCRLIGIPNQDISFYIPDRFGEGYGFNAGSVRRAKEQGCTLILTADIGVRDHQTVNLAVEAGIDVIICDHHLPPGESVPPNAVAVLCPPQAKCTYPNAALAACGVSLKLAQALLATQPLIRNYRAIMLSMLKVVAIGTIADVVSLATLENRAIVSLGLQELSSPQRRHKPGLQALLDVSGVQDLVTTYVVGYHIAPRINAAGRMASAETVVDLFQAPNETKAKELAQILDDRNTQRRVLQEKMVEDAISQIVEPVPGFIIVKGKEEDGFHRGIVGIVAGRIKDRYHRPVAVISLGEESARASVRSPPAVHAVHALDYCEDLLNKYGGHAAAAGFDVPIQNIDALEARLNQYVDEEISRQGLIPKLQCQVQCEAEDVDFQVVLKLEELGPFGQGNPQPIFWIRNAKPSRVATMGQMKAHLQFSLNQTRCIWWKGAEHLETLQSGRFDLAVRPQLNRYKGRSSVQFIVEDAIPLND